MKLFSFMALVAFAAIMIAGCTKTEVEENQPEGLTKMEMEFQTFAEGLQNEIKPKYKAVALGYFESAVSGKEEDYNKTAEAEKAYNAVMADTENSRN
jgi:hypothetical protein